MEWGLNTPNPAQKKTDGLYRETRVEPDPRPIHKRPHKALRPTSRGVPHRGRPPPRRVYWER